MRKNFVQLVLLVTVISVLASCGKKTPTEAKYIPKDASGVLVVNPKSLEDKLKSGNLTIDSFVKHLQNGADTMSAKDKKMWEGFKNSGVSLEDNVYLFFVQKGSMQKGQSTVFNVMATLKDEAKFEKFVKEQDELKDKAITKDKGFSYLTTSYNSSLAWNKDVVIVTMYNKGYTSSYDSLGNYQMPDESVGKKEQQAEVARYFNLKETETVATVPLFTDMFKEKADGYFFATSAGSLAALSATPLNLPKLEELLKDNYSASTLNFEDGKIAVKGTAYTNPFLSSILKKYAGPTVNIAALEKYPSQNINGAMLVSFNPEIFNGFLKELEVGGLIDGYLTKVGLTSADIFKSLKGEINVVVSDFTIAEKEMSMPMPDGSTYKHTSTLPTAKMVLTAAIGDKIAFARVMDKAVEAGIAVKTPTGYAKGQLLGYAGLFLAVDDKDFVLASDSATYVAYKAGTGKANVSSDIVAKLKGKSTAAFIDLNSILKASIAGVKDETGTKVLTLINNTFKNVILTADNFDGKSMKSEFEVNMTNTKQNSLVSTLNMASDIFKVFQDEKQKRRMQYNDATNAVDSVAPMK
jgi:hypothetical protein